MWTTKKVWEVEKGQLTVLTVPKATLSFQIKLFKSQFLFFWYEEDERGGETDDKRPIWLRQLHFFFLLPLSLIRLVLIITLKERLCSEIGYAQPQDGNFVQFWDNVGFERQDGGQVVQFSIETLPSRARYGYDRFWLKKTKKGKVSEILLQSIYY